MNTALFIVLGSLLIPGALGTTNLTDPIQHDGGFVGDAPDTCVPGAPNTPLEIGETSGTLWPIDDGYDHYSLGVVVGKRYTVTMTPLWLQSGSSPVRLPSGIVLPAPAYQLSILLSTTCGLFAADPQPGTAAETVVFTAVKEMCKDPVHLAGCSAVVKVAMVGSVGIGPLGPYPVPAGASVHARGEAPSAEATPPPCYPACFLDYFLGAAQN